MFIKDYIGKLTKPSNAMRLWGKSWYVPKPCYKRGYRFCYREIVQNWLGVWVETDNWVHSTERLYEDTSSE